MILQISSGQFERVLTDSAAKTSHNNHGPAIANAQDIPSASHEPLARDGANAANRISECAKNSASNRPKQSINDLVLTMKNAKIIEDNILLTQMYYLPLELRQQIFSSNITPFKRPYAPLGYIVDPLVFINFRNQRSTFRKEIHILQKLGTLMIGQGFLQSVEAKWRKEWESCMAEMITEDQEWWTRHLQRGRTILTDIHDRDFHIHDIYEHVEWYVEIKWGLNRIFIDEAPEESFVMERRIGDVDYRCYHEVEYKARCVDELLDSLRHERMMVVAGLYIVGVQLRFADEDHLDKKLIPREVEIQALYTPDVAKRIVLGLGWSPGPQIALPWGLESVSFL
jgi:hypothetical protein